MKSSNKVSLELNKSAFFWRLITIFVLGILFSSYLYN